MTSSASIELVDSGKICLLRSGHFDDLPPHLVLGLFIYGGVRETEIHEIDFEFSKFGNSEIHDTIQGWKVVYSRDPSAQPFETECPPPATISDSGASKSRFRCLKSFSVSSAERTAHSFTWLPDGVIFESFDTTDSDARPLYEPWRYAPADTDVYLPAPSHPVHMNLWWIPGDGESRSEHGDGLDAGAEVKVVLTGFQWSPDSSNQTAMAPPIPEMRALEVPPRDSVPDLAALSLLLELTDLGHADRFCTSLATGPMRVRMQAFVALHSVLQRCGYGVNIFM